MTDLIQTISSIVTGVAIPVLGIFLFYDAKKREASAKEGIEKLSQYVDSLIIVQNDKLLDYSKPITGMLFFIPSLDTLDAIAEGEL